MAQPKSTAPQSAPQPGHVHRPDCNHEHGNEVLQPIRREEPKVGRNDPCHCGSGLKYKKCHGASR